ncbi:WD repeat-containing protein 60 [Geranomyces michiganensis]|nr:WD repeat-containing protein 60 [Geranomyces michiganensis]
MTATKKAPKKPSDAPTKPTPAAGPGLRWGSEELSASAPVKGSQAIIDSGPPEDAYDEYAEDFEDYAEDFEDFEEFAEEEESIPPLQQPSPTPLPSSAVVQPRGLLEPSSFHAPPRMQRPDPMTEVQKATQAENERASSRQEQRTKEDLNAYAIKPERVSSAMPQRKFVGLETARKEAQRTKTLTAAGKRQTQRAADLSNIITLDMCFYDLFDLHPMNEYELYIRNYGSSNAVQVMDSLLEENAVQSGIPRTFTSKSALSISQGCSPLKQQSYLRGREIRDISYADTDHRLVLVAYSPVTDISMLPDPPSGLEAGGLLCLWRITDPTSPYRVLACENAPTSCCFATNKHSLVFAGTDSGSVLAWDLQELPALHPAINIGDGQQLTVQYPSYSTDGIYTLSGTHEEPIRRVVALPHAQESQAGGGVDSFLLGRLGADDAGSFQIASTDEAGVMQLWTVIEHLNASFAASEIDFGMAIGSRIRLIRSTTVQASTAKRKSAPPIAIGVLDCKFHPADIDRFLLATDSGAILNESRFRGRCHPRAFNPSDNETKMALLDAATCIDFCPHNGAVFLAGYASGTVRLFVTSESTSKVAWEASKFPITLVKWSPQRAAVFYVLDAGGVLRVWDLSESEADAAHIVTPVSTTTISGAPPGARNGKGATLVKFALSQTVSSPGTTASQMNLAAASARNVTIVFGFSDGTSEVHLLDQSLSEEAVDEASAVNVYVDGEARGQADAVAADYEDDEHEEFLEHHEQIKDDDTYRDMY